MKRKLFKIKFFKGVLTSALVLSILALALPCNCMASENQKPVENEHPCHSSTDQTSKQDQEHNNCCCDSGWCSVYGAPDISAILYKTEINGNKDITPPQSSQLSLGLNQWASAIFLIRGSPPTKISIHTHLRKNTQSLLQLWLI